jgi:hypothetical protein
MDGLREHLEKCEIEYIAAHWSGYTNILRGLSGDEIIKKLRSIGFRIKERYEADGKWVRTTGDISVSLEDGFCIK